MKENIFQKRTIKLNKECFERKKFIGEHFVCIFQLYPNLIVRFDVFFGNKVKSVTVIWWTVTNLVFSIVTNMESKLFFQSLEIKNSQINVLIPLSHIRKFLRFASSVEDL